jgi:peptidyl-prolyl cis-trans isomerase C
MSPFTKFLAASLSVLCMTTLFSADLFEDKVVAKGKGIAIQESDLEKAFIAHKAAAAAMSQPVGILDSKLREQILEKMIATKLVIARATPGDKEEGARLAEKLIAEGKRRAGNPVTYKRRLIAVGSSPEEYEGEIAEQAVVQTVIDREIGKKEIITDADVRKYYDDHPNAYKEPEKARVQHILFATRKIPSGEVLPASERAAKKDAAERAVVRARRGDDFSAMVVELSDDPEAKAQNGELTFARGQGIVPPQFESAAFSLAVEKISDPVLTVFGYHVIKLLEKMPAGQVPFEKVEEQIRTGLQREAVQKKLPQFIEQLKRDAEVEVLLK